MTHELLAQIGATAVSSQGLPGYTFERALGELWRSKFDAARNIIFDARTKDRRTPIAVVGLRDSILVQTDDATLLAHKSQAQKVKELVKKLAEDSKLKKLV